jgi:sugar phosphate isomerase/epimerase
MPTTMPDALTRRELLALSLAGLGPLAFASRSESTMNAQAQGRAWGVQLYTVRDQIRTDPASTLKAIADIGYRELEILQGTLATVAPLAKKHGLSMVSAHLDLPTIAGKGLTEFVAQARDHGLRYIVIPWVAPETRPTDRVGYVAMAGQFNRVADVVTRAGLQACYHNHAFEFGRGGDGTRWLDVIMKAAPGLKLELDVFWVSVTGADPLEVIKQYSGRIALMHLKDRNPKTERTLVETVPRDSFVEVGSGALNFPAILSAARAAGVEHYFVEQDFTPADPMPSLKKSHAYLAGLKT